MTFMFVIMALILMPILWLVFPLFISRFAFLVTSPVSLFISRTVGSIVGAFMFSGLIIGGCQGHLKKKEIVNKAMHEVVIFSDNGADPQTAEAKNDPLRDQFYFKTPILGFNLGMTLPQMESLMGANKDALKIADDYISKVPGEILLGVDPELFGCDINTIPTIFAQNDNPYGLLVYEISDKSKCPVQLENLDRIELAFIGGRLIGIHPWFREPRANIVFDALKQKYEVISYKPRFSDHMLIKVDDKECVVSKEPEIVNLPYLRALVKDSLMRKKSQKINDEKARKDEASRI